MYNRYAPAAAVSPAPASSTTGDNSRDVAIPAPPEDSISALHWSPASEHLAASSWAGDVRVWGVDGQGNANPVAQFRSDGPVLDCRWNKAGNAIASAGSDGKALLFDVTTQQTRQVGAHDAPIRHVRWFEENNANILVTGSWDKTVRYWDLRQPTPIGHIQCAERVYCMDLVGSALVVGTANRTMHIVHMGNPTQIYRTFESSLKWQLRTLAIYPNQKLFAIGSVEGRVAIQAVDEANATSDFTFRCHRDQSTTPPKVYAINSIVTHPVYGTVGTAGSDGAFHIWDTEARVRLKLFQQAGGGRPITDAAFSRQGNIMAYAVSYDWCKGHEHAPAPGTPNANVIKLHAIVEEEVKPKPPKKPTGVVGRR
ncbi:WD40-repeat-containing domain protein [Blastocladiella britannica]|nr:WD40-repeat-containing domain protein [Blastocladiella britannica]